MKRTVVAVAVAVAVVAGGATGWFVTDGHRSGETGATYSLVGLTPTTSVTTSQLVHGAWSMLPAAPIAGREGGVGLWTGHDMFIWGGSPMKGPMLADGATYDPVARAWSLVPAAPLSARYQSAAVMAGRVAFIWGGQGPITTAPVGAQLAARYDGATYEPVTRTWTALPPGPRDPYQSARALWTGSKVILLTSLDGANQHDPAVIHAHSYDPATRVWTTLPNLTLPANQTVEFFGAVSTGSQIWVWPHWYHTVSTGPNSTATGAGVGTYVYDVAARDWTSRGIVGRNSGTMTNPLWTGREILVPFRTFWCGLCIGGLRFAEPGLRIDPTVSTPRPLPVTYGSPQNAVPDTHMDYLWTGRDLVAYNSGTETTGGGSDSHHPGEAAAWDPDTNTWQNLPRAPLSGYGGVSVWTGSRLLIWGDLSSPTHSGGTQTAGIEFVPQA